MIVSQKCDNSKPKERKFRLINTILARILETRDNRFNPLQDSTNTFTHSLIISPSSPSNQREFELNFQSTHDLSSDISSPTVVAADTINPCRACVTEIAEFRGYIWRGRAPF